MLKSRLENDLYTTKKAKLMILLPEHHQSSKQNPFSQSDLLTIKSLNCGITYSNLKAFINHYNRRDIINLGNDSEVRVAFSTHTLFVCLSVGGPTGRIISSPEDKVTHLSTSSRRTCSHRRSSIKCQFAVPRWMGESCSAGLTTSLGICTT